MRLREVLYVLSKRSSYAVSTERDNTVSNELDRAKSYLYVETEIEVKFEELLSSLSHSEPKVVFLCGSSGDGKSEILTRYKNNFSHRVDFHLDATHSFSPTENAIQTLDRLFTEYQTSPRSLVVGINIGMLGNYANEGSVEAIKTAINLFLENKKSAPNFEFINFEDYPKFTLDATGHHSVFTKRILHRITEESTNNVFREFLALEETLSHPDQKLITNFKLLSLPEVQNRIVDILFKGRLIKDQFLTSRALLDFIYVLLTADGFLFDNLFSLSDSELSNKIIEFDPANKRTNKLDKFVLKRSLSLTDDGFDTFVSDMQTLYNIPKLPNPYSYLRLFYILAEANLSNGYHKIFQEDFSEKLLSTYAKLWNLHKNAQDTPEAKRELKAFYRETVITAIHKYINRNATSLGKGLYLTSSHNGYQVVFEVDIKPDLKGITLQKVASPSYFIACLKINDAPLEIPININLLNLMENIVNGYRPNKHDKNAVILLDEVTKKLRQLAATSKSLQIFHNDKRYSISSVDGDLEVSGYE